MDPASRGQSLSACTIICRATTAAAGKVAIAISNHYATIHQSLITNHYNHDSLHILTKHQALVTHDSSPSNCSLITNHKSLVIISIGSTI